MLQFVGGAFDEQRLTPPILGGKNLWRQRANRSPSGPLLSVTSGLTLEARSFWPRSNSLFVLEIIILVSIFRIRICSGLTALWIYQLPNFPDHRGNDVKCRETL